MKSSSEADYREIIAALSPAKRRLLRTRAEDPFGITDTRPFYRTGKATDKYIYIAHRPNRHTKESLGSPAGVLNILDDLRVTADEPRLLVPAAQLPLVPEPPRHLAIRWRVPLILTVIAAFCSILVTLEMLHLKPTTAKIRESPLRVVAQTAALQLPQDSTPNTDAANLHVVPFAPPTATTSVTGPVTPSVGIGAVDTCGRQTSSQAAASGKIHEVFAAIVEAFGKEPSILQPDRNGHAAVALTGRELLKLLAILETLPRSGPILPRLCGPDEEDWTTRGLRRTVTTNLSTVAYRQGTLILCVQDAADLRATFRDEKHSPSDLASWGVGDLYFEVLTGRLEIREVQ